MSTRSQKQKYHTRLKLELIWGLLITTVSVGLFSVLRNGFSSGIISRFDTELFYFLYSLRTPVATAIMTLFSFMGVQLTIVLFLVVTLFLLRKNHKGDIIVFSTIVILGGVVNVLLKDVIQRPRPTLSPLYNMYNDYSFPSAHAMNSLLFYATASYIVFHITRNRREGSIVTIISVLLVLMVGISRVYLGVHYPSDVLAGYLAGLAWFSAILSLEKAYLFFHTSR